MTDDLATATAALNDVLSRAEAAISALNLGVTASVAPPDHAECFLRWGKQAGAWRLLYVDADGTVTPLLSASRSVRTMAAALLPALHAALQDVVRTETNAVRIVTKAAEDFIARLPGRDEAVS